MAINVEYAPRGGGYSQAMSQRRNYRPEEDEEVVNPYVLDDREGARISARLRADRERLGQKQREKYGADYFKDTEAGFDIQEPVTIWQDEKNGVRTGKVVYRNLGKDPIGTGGFGALGSAEKVMYDPEKTIDPRNYEDLRKLEAVLGRKGYNNLQISGDAFLSQEELADKQAKKKADEEFVKFEKEQRLRNELSADMEGLRSKNRVELELQKESGRAKRQAEGIAARQAYVDQAKSRGAAAAVGALEDSIDVAISALDADQREGYQLSAEDAKFVRELPNAISKAKGDTTNVEEQAKFLDMIHNRLNRIRPQRTIQPQLTPEQELRRKIEERRALKGVDQEFEKPAATQMPFSESEFRSKMQQMERATGVKPSNEQVEAELAKDYVAVKQANIRATGMGQSPDNPIKIGSVLDYQAVPSGGFYKDPEGNIKRKK